MIKETKANDIIKIICKTAHNQRKMVKEVTVDITSNMKLAIKKMFP